MVAGDNITAGSRFTRAFLKSQEITSGSVTLPAGTGTTVAPKLWIMVDADDAVKIDTPVTSGSTITVANPSTNVWRFTSSEAAAFSNVQVGDFVIITDDAIRAQDNDFIGHFRVTAKTNTYFDVYISQSLGSTFGPITLNGSFKINFIRTSKGTIQPINLLTGLNTLNAIA